MPRMWVQYKVTEQFEKSLIAQIDGMRNHRFKTSALCEILEAGCKNVTSPRTKSYLAAYQNNGARMRRQVSVEEALSKQISDTFWDFTKVREEQFFLALCLGLEKLTGKNPEI